MSVHDVVGNESMAAGPVMRTANDMQAPKVPQSSTASNITTNSATLTGLPPTDEGGSGLAGYRIFRYGTLRSTVMMTMFTDTGLGAGTHYRYTVAAHDSAGNQSVLSSQVPARSEKRQYSVRSAVGLGLVSPACQVPRLRNE